MSSRQRAIVGRTYHKEEIRCPECSSQQTAEVEHTAPFHNFVHECTSCGTWIQESEWTIIQDEAINYESEPGMPGEWIGGHRSPEISDAPCDEPLKEPWRRSCGSIDENPFKSKHH